MKNTTSEHNEYSVNPHLYLKIRPQYGKEIFEHLDRLTTSKKIAWDCATGNGQAAVQLSNYFDEVHATDSNPRQLQHALHIPNIDYYVASETNPKLKDNSVDLITVATAIHWLDRPTFYKEVERVLKPGGILAVWGYTGINIHPDIDPILSEIIEEYLMPYYSDNIQLAFSGYKTLDFPYTTIKTPALRTQIHYTFDDLTQYICTWSSSQKYIRQNNHSPIDLFQAKLKKAWGDLSCTKLMTWDFICHIGRK